MSSEAGNSRDHFSSQYGALVAIVGSAVGLGNIWRFPYIAGVYGGGAIILLYIVFVLIMGRPLLLTELTLGRLGQGNAYGAFQRMNAPGMGRLIGAMGIGAAFIIMSFYTAIGGWTMAYIVKSATGEFAGASSQEIQQVFDSFVTHPVWPVVWQALFLLATMFVVMRGVSKGIERFSRLMMPLLLLLLVVMGVRAITLPGGMDGLKFLFRPDLSKLSPESVMAALGQVFFSLSLGMGAILTYGSYLSRKADIVKSAKYVTFADTVISLLASIAIFPAVFAFGLDPTSGPGLLFETLPNVFGQMPAGQVFSFIFFFLVFIAALTSAMSLHEVVVVFAVEEFGMRRPVAAALCSALIMVLGVFCSLSLGIMSDFTLFGKSVFDLMDFISSNILLPAGGLCMTLFLGYVLPRDAVEAEISSGGRYRPHLALFYFLVRYVVPIAVFLIFLNGIC